MNTTGFTRIPTELREECIRLFCRLEEFFSPERLRAFANVSGLELVSQCIPASEILDFDILIINLLHLRHSPSKPALLDLLDALAFRYQEDMRGVACKELEEKIKKELLHAAMANPTHRDQVFFSYSHKDKKWLEVFRAALKPLIRANQLSVWDDTKIKAGDVWRDEIKRALASAKVAVLIVSMNFLNSDFIAEHELPPLLEAAQNEGLRVLLVVVGHSLFEETELGRYQAVNDPSRPLASISAASREKEIVRICKEIKAASSNLPTEVLEETLSERPLSYLTVDIETPDLMMYEVSKISYEYTVQQLIDGVVDGIKFPRFDGNKVIYYSLVSYGGTLDKNRTLLESGVKNGDQLRLVSSKPMSESGATRYESNTPNLTEQPRRLRVFLCHSSGDKQEVRKLYQRLFADGFDPWLDEEKLLPGQDWELEITKSVRGSDVVLVCLSKGSITKSGYIHKEIRYALDVADEQREGTIFLIPLRLEECESPDRLRRWHWVNLFEEAGYERLKQSLNSRAGELGLNKSNSYKPEPQDSSYINLPILLADIQPEHSETRTIIIWITKTNQRYQVIVPLDATVESLKEFLLKELKIARRLEDGQLIPYRINSKSLSRVLHDNATLRQSGVPEMDILTFHTEFIAG
jgi:uncharacterized ubiquitin-like protein YukD